LTQKQLLPTKFRVAYKSMGDWKNVKRLVRKGMIANKKDGSFDYNIDWNMDNTVIFQRY
jgi:hypothetical protein